MRPIVPVVACILLSLALAGCLEEGPPPEVREVLEEWEADREAHPETGLAGTFELGGRPLHVTGNLSSSRLGAPVDLAVEPLFPSDDPLTYLRNATVEPVGSGLVVVQGADVRVRSGALVDLEVDRATANGSVRLDPVVVSGADEPDKPNATFPPTWDNANESFFFTEFVDVAGDAVQLIGFQRAVLIRDDGFEDLAGTFTVDFDGLWWDRASHVNASRVTLRGEPLSAGGNVSSGSATAGDVATDRARAVFAHGGRVDVTGTRVASNGTLRITQVLDPDRPVIDARVEVAPEEDRVTVDEGNETWTKVHFREATFEGDAVLEEIEITGDGAAMVTVPLQRPPGPIDELWDLVNGSGPAAPWVALGAALASPFIALAEFLRCLLSGCPEKHPYPTWMDAGTLDAFYYRINGSMAPGTYDATIHIRGQNHDTVEIPVTIRVSEASGT